MLPAQGLLLPRAFSSSETIAPANSAGLALATYTVTRPTRSLPRNWFAVTVTDSPSIRYRPARWYASGSSKASMKINDAFRPRALGGVHEDGDLADAAVAALASSFQDSR